MHVSRDRSQGRPRFDSLHGADSNYMIRRTRLMLVEKAGLIATTNLSWPPAAYALSGTAHHEAHGTL